MELKFSVAAGAGEVVELPTWTIHNMQDMNSTICTNAEMHTTGQLTDLRDGKQYWVTKLKDGNCWMTQNLDFDIPSTLNTDGITSDISTTDFTTNTIKVATPSEWPNTNDNPKYNGYYDPGDYIYNGPSNNHGIGIACGDASGTDSLSACDQFTAAVANTNAYGNITNHYHVGNYYSWPAATVKSGDSIAAGGTSAPNSICPKGWKLPTSTSATTGQIAELLIEYGVNSSAIGNNYTIYGDPLYFVYSGGFISSTLLYAGIFGNYWSSTVHSTTSAFYLVFSPNVRPDNPGDRFSGFPVRCVAE